VLLTGLWPLRPLPAQTREADSLRRLLAIETRPDTTRARRLRALSVALLLADAAQSTAALEQALALSRRLNDTLGLGPELLGLGTRYRRQADYARARASTREAQAVFARRHDTLGLANTFMQWSLIENEQENPAASLRAALQGLPYAEAAHNLVAANRLRVSMANVYVQLHNYEDVLLVLRPIFDSPAAQTDEHMVASALSLMGSAYQQLHDVPRAMRYFRRSARLNRRLGDSLSVITDEISISALYAGLGRLPAAMRHAALARAVTRATHDTYNQAPAALAVARVYLLQGQADSALALAQYAYALSLPTRSNESLRTACDLLAQAYARQGNFAQAYRYQERWAAYEDSVSGVLTQQRSSALRYGYQLARKQDQIALLTQSRELQAQRAFRQRQEMRALLVGLAGLLLLLALLARNIFLKQRANRTLNEKNEEIGRQRDRLDKTLTKLKTTQTQLVQSEKMVALAALTSGVAHEMQNPLNFVNNFSEVSLELLNELEEEHQKAAPNADLTIELLADLKQNLLKINQHGDRASGIVKGMLEHAHADPGQCQAINLNSMAQEYLRLAYHALQAKHQNFEVARSFDLDPTLGPLCVVPQEMGRVLLNLFTNAFYAVHEKAALLGPDYVPSVRVRTRRISGGIELHVRDNGPGIPTGVMDKIFDPFFTTKPPGEGTGLGLWLTYDIVTKGYGGTLTARSEIGAFAEFIVMLPQDQTVPVVAPELVEVEGSE
ncbi:MAG: ATP-binding protein, partial [Bacteroidota bacterium]|nr:ATP-binding protein [Bacteroidota bacterium]